VAATSPLSTCRRKHASHGEHHHHHHDHHHHKSHDHHKPTHADRDYEKAQHHTSGHHKRSDVYDEETTGMTPRPAHVPEDGKAARSSGCGRTVLMLAAGVIVIGAVVGVVVATGGRGGDDAAAAAPSPPASQSAPAYSHQVEMAVTIAMPLSACDTAFKVAHCAKLTAEAGLEAERCQASCQAGSVVVTSQISTTTASEAAQVETRLRPQVRRTSQSWLSCPLLCVYGRAPQAARRPRAYLAVSHPINPSRRACVCDLSWRARRRRASFSA
jgi:hypothetical protein